MCYCHYSEDHHFKIAIKITFFQNPNLYFGNSSLYLAHKVCCGSLVVVLAFRILGDDKFVDRGIIDADHILKQ